MAFRKVKEPSPMDVVMGPSVKAITASAVEVTTENSGWVQNNFGDGAWQADAWRFYDTTPELHNTADYIGAACSMVRLYVAEVDEYGVMQGEVGAPSTGKDGEQTSNSNPAIAGLISTMFGGPGGKSEILRNLGTSMTIAGETYLIGKGTGRKNPEWFTVAPNQIRIMPEHASVTIGNGRWDELDYRSNMILRVWTPHSAVPWRATSPTQGILIPLRQSQELVRFLSSQLVSRLASASLLPVPANVDFPPTDKHAGGWNGLLQDLYEVITSNLQGSGTAAMIAPIIMPLQPDALAAMANVQPITFESVLSAQAIDLRKELRETIAIGLNVPMEIQLSGEGRANHWCQSMDTEIYTRDGWKRQDELTIGDDVLTLNHDTGQSEWQPILDIYRADVVNEPMLSMQGQAHKSLSTMNHRWAVTNKDKRAWTTSGQGFKQADRIPVAAPIIDDLSALKHSDDLVTLAAAYTSDGTILRDPSSLEHIRIVKFDEREISELRNLLTRMFGRDGFREGTHPTRTRRGVAFNLRRDAAQALFDITGEHKALKLDFIQDLTRAQLSLLLDSMISIGDGVRRGNSITLFQVEPTRLDAFEMAATLLGKHVTRGIREQGEHAFGTRPLHWITITSKADVAPFWIKQEIVDYTGLIWCPVTANKTWLARHENTVFFTGNSIWWANEEFIIKTIAPLMNRICDALTKGFLAKALRKMGLDPAKYTIWYDTAPLSNSANQLVDAKDLYTLGVISAAELRARGNFHASAAPSDEESQQRFVKDVVLRDPAQFALESVRKFLDIDIPDYLPEPVISELDEAGPPPPPVPDRAMSAPSPGQKPSIEMSESEIIASAMLLPSPSALLVASDVTARRALELAGKRMLTSSLRGMYADLPAHKMHTKVKVSGEPAHMERILAGAWDHVDEAFEGLGVQPARMRALLDQYVKGLINANMEHNRSLLAAFLAGQDVRP